MKTLIYTMTVAWVLGLAGVAQAEHKKDCKNVHGRVTVVTDDSIAVNDKVYKVGDSTRIIKGGDKVKVSQIKSGDVVCVDTRGKADIDGEVAGVKVLDAAEGEAALTEKETVKEKEKVKEKTREKTE
jgi:hypothetical protein